MNFLNRRHIYDRLAGGIITAGGFALIVIILGMMGFIIKQALPLWSGAELSTASAIELAQDTNDKSAIKLIGQEEQREILFALTDSGAVRFMRTSDQKELQTFHIPLQTGEHIIHAMEAFASHRIACVTDQGRIIEAEIKFSSQFTGDHRSIIPELHILSVRTFSKTKTPVRGISYAVTASDAYVAVAKENTAYYYKSSDTVPSLVVTDAVIRSMAINPLREEIVLGLEDGHMERWDIRETNAPTRIESVAATAQNGIAVTALAYLIGDISLIVGDEEGRVSGWMEVKHTDGSKNFARIRDFDRHESSIQAITASWRNKCFVTADGRGVFKLFHSTSNRLLLEQKLSFAPSQVSYAPKADGLVFLSGEGRVENFALHNPHPESNWQTLFGEVWYESYDAPGYTWQSTGGTDDFEPKFSLIPLIFGTLKATLYAMLFAAPLAILGALYTSQFAHPRIRTIVKPTVEIMAALPSVVIGFIAGLWLAPLLKNVLIEFIAVITLLPLLIILFVLLFDKLPKKWTNPFRHGYEVFLMLPVLAISIWIGYMVGYWIETNMLGGDVQNWLYQTLGIRYDQRNSIIIGIAMAFAVMPIIFTITEDALSSVPKHLTSASLALGATRWQTAIKVVLPAASAAIFSAVMIGFGRAVGETMIVLMATGNTPIMDWSIFNGMRTLSANIAVEIPEAPEGGTLYRVLFLSGLLLFVITFVVNTLAEIVRQRLRKKYASM